MATLSMDVEVETPTSFMEEFMRRQDIPLQERIDALLNEIFGDLESELDSDEMDEYDASDEVEHCYVSEDEDETPCACNYSKCQGDCGTLHCGCIDICRGRCGIREHEY